MCKNFIDTENVGFFLQTVLHYMSMFTVHARSRNSPNIIAVCVSLVYLITRMLLPCVFILFSCVFVILNFTGSQSGQKAYTWRLFFSSVQRMMSLKRFSKFESKSTNYV